VKLHDLHTPVPLNEDDYAAIRASVHAELSARRHRRRFALALATAATLAFALWLQTPKPAPQVIAPKQPPIACDPCGAGNPAGVLPVKIEHPPAERIVGARPRPRKKQPVQPDPIRIELHTHDPDIRIIWIVSPDKEES